MDELWMDYKKGNVLKIYLANRSAQDKNQLASSIKPIEDSILFPPRVSLLKRETSHTVVTGRYGTIDTE